MVDAHKKISFIIPAYNAEKYIETCVHSILDIKYDDIELIVVNDGSTDKTAAILSNIKDPRLCVIDQKNQGVSSARNNGINHASGDYIAFADADDVIKSDEISVLLEKLDFDCDMYMFQYEIESGKANRVLPLPIPAGKYGRKELRELRNRLYDSAFSKNYESKYFGGKIYQYLYARKFLNDNNITFPPDVHFAEDCNFCFKCFHYADSIEVHEDCAYHYIVYSESASHRYRPNFWNELKDSYQRACMVAGEEIGHKNELYVYYGATVAFRNVRHFWTSKEKAIEKINELLSDQDFYFAVCNTSYDSWTLYEKMMISIFRTRKAARVYQFMKMKCLFKGIKK